MGENELRMTAEEAKDYLESQRLLYVNKGISDLIKLPKLYQKDFEWSDLGSVPSILILCKDLEDIKRLEKELELYHFENLLVFATKNIDFISMNLFAIFKSKNVPYESETFKTACDRVRARCYNTIIGGSLFFTPVWVVEEV